MFISAASIEAIGPEGRRLWRSSRSSWVADRNDSRRRRLRILTSIGSCAFTNDRLRRLWWRRPQSVVSIHEVGKSSATTRTCRASSSARSFFQPWSVRRDSLSTYGPRMQNATMALRRCFGPKCRGRRSRARQAARARPSRKSQKRVGICSRRSSSSALAQEVSLEDVPHCLGRRTTVKPRP